MDKKFYTRKELRAVTGAAGYVIDYLNDCNRLPIRIESKGKGYPRLYAPGAIKIIKAHLAKIEQPNFND